MKEKGLNYQFIFISLLVIIVLLVGAVVFLAVDNHKTTNTPSNEGGFVSDNNVSSTTPNDSNILLDENSDINTSNDTSTSNSTNTNNYISRDKAIEIALNHAKLEKSSVRDLDADLERKYNTVVYEVDFEYQNYDYEYYIDATKGTIVHSFKEIDH